LRGQVGTRVAAAGQRGAEGLLERHREHAGDPAQGVMFIWAPTGVPLDLCASDIYPGRVRLRPCTGSLWQRWVATQVGSTGFFTWTSKGSGRIIQSNGRGNVLTTVPAPKTPSANQEWKFSS
jgi:hypothetical protein